jgi:hypothetical protein
VNGGVGLGGLLLVSFIVLKLHGDIDWPWGWVLSPMWIGAILWLLALVAAIALSLASDRKEDKARQARQLLAREGRWR